MMPPVLETPRTERIWTPDEDWQRTPLGLYVPPRPSKRDLYSEPVAVDLFCGAGGMGLGFHQAGFHVAAAMDHDADCAITYMHNLARPGVRIHCDTPESEARLEKAIASNWKLNAKSKARLADGSVVPYPHMTVAGSGWIKNQPASHRGCEHFFFGDIRNFKGEQILDALGLEKGEIDVVTGGPPCQGFSTAGRRNVLDPRNSLVFEFARLVVELAPAAFVFENVPGIISMVTPEGTPVIDEFAAYVASGGYGSVKSIKSALVGNDQARIVRRERPIKKADDEPDDDEGEDEEAQFEQTAMAL